MKERSKQNQLKKIEFLILSLSEKTKVPVIKLVKKYIQELNWNGKEKLMPINFTIPAKGWSGLISRLSLMNKIEIKEAAKNSFFKRFFSKLKEV